MFARQYSLFFLYLHDTLDDVLSEYRVFETIHTKNKTRRMKLMRTKRVTYITQAAMIAAIYVVLTLFISAFHLANGAIQIRISEALTILPVFTPAAIPGLFLGCAISNLLTGALLPDIVFGSLATLLGAYGTYLLRKNKWAATLPPILSNTLIIPYMLSYIYHFPGSVSYFMITVGLGEIISCGILGMIVHNILARYRSILFKS